ncbi:hypothetical protein EG832_02600 [bacterium]|nr:hypothetical protein [bacterium]
MRIKKIKLETGKVFIEYSEEKPDGKSENYTLESTDKPLQSFKDALQGLAGYIGEICELPEDYCTSITVRGVSFSYGGENKTMGATITGLTLKYANAPLVINTPHLPSAPYSKGSDESCLLPDECYFQLMDLQDEANKFLEGQREPDAQMNLFNNPDFTSITVSTTNQEQE